MPEGAGDLWVFAYGSLMWVPGFRYQEAQGARLHGYHRSLCILSIRSRGTEACPGLVLGLDRGGSCAGRAFRVAAGDVADTQAYLMEREMPTAVYRPTHLPVGLDDGRRVAALAFVARRDHPQYTGRLAPERAAALVAQGRGPRGTAIDYLENVVRHLDDLGIRETAMHEVLRLATAKAGGKSVSIRQLQ